MSRIVLTTLILAALIAPGAAALAAAQPAARGSAQARPASPKPATTRADFYGTWERVGSLNFDPTVPGNQVETPPLTPKARAQYEASLKAAADGAPNNNPHANCTPQGMPRMMNMVYLMEILPADDKFTIISEESSQVRRIWTDGRGVPAPDDLWPTYNGFSYGHWEGNTLVARTVGLRADTPINRLGLMHSGNLVIDERIWLEDRNTVKNQITLTDPEIFERPWVATKTYRRTSDPVHEYVCTENNRNPVDANGVTGVTLQSGK